jgi:hypothetical protein
MTHSSASSVTTLQELEQVANVGKSWASQFVLFVNCGSQIPLAQTMPFAKPVRESRYLNSQALRALVLQLPTANCRYSGTRPRGYEKRVYRMVVNGFEVLQLPVAAKDSELSRRVRATADPRFRLRVSRLEHASYPGRLLEARYK